MLPVLKWAGGKRWFVTQYGKWLQSDADTYLEPFLGSGAVFFRIKPRRAILNDLNEALIETYMSLRDEPNKVWKHLKCHQRKHNKEYYYLVRNQKPRTSAARAAKLIYLNRTCFNGLYRVNLDGIFNVPKGTKGSVILPSDDFKSVSVVLQAASLLSRDFSEVILKSKEGDFLYIDPPYTVRHNNNNFLKYNEHIFSWSDQKRLANYLAKAARRGSHILMSNADHSSIRDLYSDKIWVQFSVRRLSLLASSAVDRRETTELVVSNYLNRQGEHVAPRY